MNTIDDNKKKDGVVNVRLPLYVREEIVKQARRYGLGVSGYIRMQIMTKVLQNAKTN